MAKRMTDTDKWKKNWFKKLPLEYKLLWLYILDDCNHAGVWDVDMDVVELRVGAKFSIEKIRGYFQKNVVVLDENKWFVPDFIEFQYGHFTEKNNMYKSIIPILEKYNLKKYIKNEGGLNGVVTPSRGGKVKVTVKETVTKKDYENILSKIQDGSDDLVFWDEIKNFIKENKPDFFEPYLDLWNIFAIKNKLIKQNQHVTDERIKKFNTRIKEPEFDFLKILECVQRSDFAKGNNSTNWKVTIEFILNSQENYIKILEGKYE